MREAEPSMLHKGAAACTATAVTPHQQIQNHNNDEAAKTTAANTEAAIETAAIAKLLETTQQNIAINDPPSTGGVIGFETNKRRKTQHATKPTESKSTGEAQTSAQISVPHQIPHTLQTLPGQISAVQPQICQPNQASSIAEPKEEGQTPYHQHVPVPPHKTGKMTHANPSEDGENNQPASVPPHETGNTNISEDVEASDKATIQIWIIQDDKLEPYKIKVPVGTTPDQLTQAEARLKTMVRPIFPRTWIGTPLPLYEPLQDKQVVYLHQQPPSIKCPAITGIQPTEVVQPPVCRIHVLWKQQSWVALDEMLFYLEGTIASEDTKVFLPEKFFHEAAVNEEAGAWLHRPLAEVDDKTTFASAAIVQGHWVPVMITRHDRCIRMTTTPEGSCFLRAAQEITEDPGLTLEVHQKVMPQACAADCGFQAFAWIVAMHSGLQPTALPAHKAEQWRYMFAHQLLQTGHHTDIIHHLPL